MKKRSWLISKNTAWGTDAGYVKYQIKYTFTTPRILTAIIKYKTGALTTDSNFGCN
jgi:hypothetical protein